MNKKNNMNSNQDQSLHKMNFIPKQPDISINQKNQSNHNTITSNNNRNNMNQASQPIIVPPESNNHQDGQSQSINKNSHVQNNQNNGKEQKVHKSIKTYSIISHIKHYWQKWKQFNHNHKTIATIIYCAIGLFLCVLVLHTTYDKTIIYPHKAVTMPNKTELNQSKHCALQIQNQFNEWHIPQNEQNQLVNHYTRLDTNRQIFVYNRAKFWQHLAPGKQMKFDVIKKTILSNNL